MRQFLRIVTTSLPLGLCLTAPAWADPVPVSVRVSGAVTELLIDSGDLKPTRFRRNQCGARLSMPLDQGMDVTAASTGGGRIRGVALADPQTLLVTTDCGAAISIKRRNQQMVMTIAAPVQPAKKPAALVPTPAPTVAADAAPQTLLSPQEVEFARKAVADGVRDAAQPAPRDPAPPKAAARDPRLPDPGWGSEGALVDLAAWRQEPFMATRDRLRQALAAGAQVDRKALLDMVRFQMGWNLGAEALATLRDQVPAGEEPSLSAVAAVLADPRDGRADWVLTNQALRAADGPLWAAALLERRGQGRDAARYLPAAARALPSLPPDLRRAVGLDLLSIAAEVGLDGMARAIARSIEADAGDPVAQAALHYQVGRLHAARGRQALALTQFDQAAALDGPLAARARLAAVVLRVERGEATLADRITTLEQVAADWPATPLEADCLWQLALLDQGSGDILGALEHLRLLNLRFPDRPPAAMAAQADMAVALFDGLAGPAGDGIALTERIITFHRQHGLLPAEPAGWAVRRRFASMLAASGVERIARDELQLLATQVPAEDRPAIAFDLAGLELAAGDAGAALATLDGMGDVPAADAKRGRELRGRALLMAGDPAGAVAAIGDDDGPESLSIKAASLWQQGQWREAVKTYRQLAADRPLPPHDAARFALAAMLADDPSAAGILDRQLPVLEGRKWADGLPLLGRPVPAADAGERDLRGLLDDAGALSRLVAAPGAN